MAALRYRLKNIITAVWVDDEPEEEHYLAVLNPLEQRKRLIKDRKVLWQPAGGGALLTQTGERRLRRLFEATEFKKVIIDLGGSRQKVTEASFYADERHFGGIVEFFRAPRADEFEVNPWRELEEELAGKEYPGIRPILTPRELDTCKWKPEGFCVQPPRKEGYGASRHPVPSRNLLRCFSLTVSRAVFTKMANSKAVRFLLPEEVASTEGGTRRGKTLDGEEIFYDVFRPTFELEPSPQQRPAPIPVRPSPAAPHLRSLPLFDSSRVLR